MRRTHRRRQWARCVPLDRKGEHVEPVVVAHHVVELLGFDAFGQVEFRVGDSFLDLQRVANDGAGRD